jgi:hypothetical protein
VKLAAYDDREFLPTTLNHLLRRQAFDFGEVSRAQDDLPNDEKPNADELNAKISELIRNGIISR